MCFWGRRTPDIGQFNSKPPGDEREASALRDEVCHLMSSIYFFITDADRISMYLRMCFITTIIRLVVVKP